MDYLSANCIGVSWRLNVCGSRYHTSQTTAQDVISWSKCVVKDCLWIRNQTRELGKPTLRNPEHIQVTTFVKPVYKNVPLPHIYKCIQYPKKIIPQLNNSQDWRHFPDLLTNFHAISWSTILAACSIFFCQVPLNITIEDTRKTTYLTSSKQNDIGPFIKQGNAHFLYNEAMQSASKTRLKLDLLLIH